MLPNRFELFKQLVIDSEIQAFISTASKFLQNSEELFPLLKKEEIFMTFCSKCMQKDISLPEAFQKEYQRVLTLRNSYNEIVELITTGNNKSSITLVKGSFYESIYPQNLKRDWHDIDYFFRDFSAFEPVFQKLCELGYTFSKRLGTYWYKDTNGLPIVSMFLHRPDIEDPDHQIECQVGYFPLTWTTGTPYGEFANTEGEFTNVKHHFFYWVSRKTKEIPKFGIRDLLDFHALRCEFILNEDGIADLKRLLVKHGILDSERLAIIDYMFHKEPEEWECLFDANLGLENSWNFWHFKQWGKLFSQSARMLLWEEMLKIIVERKSAQSASWYAPIEPLLSRLLYWLKVPLYINLYSNKRSSIYPTIQLGQQKVQLSVFER